MYDDYNGFLKMVSKVTTHSDSDSFVRVLHACEIMNEYMDEYILFSADDGFIDCFKLRKIDNMTIATITEEDLETFDSMFKEEWFKEKYKSVFGQDEDIDIEFILMTINAAFYAVENPTKFFDEESETKAVSKNKNDVLTVSLVKFCMPIEDIVKHQIKFTENDFLTRIGF